MKLGNSGGNNMGKKYLKRNNLDHERLTAQDYARLDDFNTWYTDNIDQLESELKDKESFDEDILNDTYSRICESILFSKLDIINYKGYFCRSFFTNYIQNKIKESRYISKELFPIPDIIEDSNDEELVKQRYELVEEALLYIEAVMNKNDAHVFRLYITHQPEMTYMMLAKILGMKVYVIQGIVSKAKKLIRNNKELNKKRVEIY